jgi:hypothetical protein
MADAMAVCSDGLRVTSNGGRAWHPVTGLPVGQVTDVALTSGGDAAATLAGVKGCHGTLVSATTDGGQSWSDGQCLKAIMQRPAISMLDSGTGLIVAGSVTYTTSNGGKSWSAAA